MADDKQIAFEEYIKMSEEIGEIQDLPIMACRNCLKPGTIRMSDDKTQFFCLSCDRRWWVQ